MIDMGSDEQPQPSLSADPTEEHSSIGMATWNVRGFARPDCDDLAEVLRSHPLSLIAVQELQRSQARRLSNLLGMQHLWSFKHSPLGPFVRFAEGLALFSAETLSNFETLNLTPKIRPHSHRRRIAQFAYLDRLETDVVNIHLASHGDSSARSDQLRVALDRVEQRGAQRCIVAGDFNADGEASLYRALHKAGFSDAWSAQPQGSATELDGGAILPGQDAGEAIRTETSTGPGFTNPAGKARARLDRIFVRGFDVRSAAVPVDDPQWAQRSDHLPVFARLELTTAADLGE
jgi:endonuclease/exonuclease/phosphatase family metal-dependent hydrolase